MSLLDFLILTPILYGLIRGIMRGFVGELTSLVAIVAGVIGTKLLSPMVAQWLQNALTWDANACQLLAWFVIFVSIVLLLHGLGKLLSRLLKAMSLGAINRLIGAVFGAAKWALIVSILLNGFAMLDARFSILKPQTKEKSIAYEPIRKVAAITWDTLQDNVSNP